MKKIILTAAITALLSFNASATITATIFNQAQDAGGGNLANDRLVQLVNLGPDGIFNDIVSDGDLSTNGQWVSGDDSLVNLGFGSAEFSSARAFDGFEGAGGAAGYIDRIMQLDETVLLPGTKVGIRWFPSIAATSFAGTTLAGMGNVSYGQFTRQSGGNGGDFWVIPATGTVNFDTLEGPDIGAGLALASKTLNIPAVPEPASVSLLMLGCASIGLRRRRKAE